jgi:hypothetical protein
MSEPIRGNREPLETFMLTRKKRLSILQKLVADVPKAESGPSLRFSLAIFPPSIQEQQ